MSSCSLNPYDLVPYASHPIPRSHPAHLATIAALLSLPAPPVATARVLELGSAAGGNLIPLAYDHPNARFVGVDYSAGHISEGRRLIDALEVPNIELRHSNIMEVDAQWGQFDYIICHGVYSWVPPHVQDKILGIASELLTADGIAYISYNTYPGWHLRSVVREMMRYHALRFNVPSERLTEARRALDVIASNAVPPDGSPYGSLLQDEAETMTHNLDHYVYHEHLNDSCEPLYFHEFIRRARGVGLDYVGEPELAGMVTANGGALGKALSSLARDPIELEQFLDYCTGRTFRRTLLRRAGCSPSFDLPSRALWPMFIASGARPQTAVDLTGTASTTFINRAGDCIATTLPLLKAAFLKLIEHWPAAIPFEELLTDCAARLGLAVTDLQRTLLGRAILAVLTRSQAIEVSLDPSRFTIAPGERPTASLLARQQAGAAARVTNRRHQFLELSANQRRVIQSLNGSRDEAEVARQTQLPKEDVRDHIAQLARLALILD